jgi:branched-chain amino acid transport system substrate-binding protein
MRRLAALAVLMLAAALGGPVRGEVLIGMAGPLTGNNAWFGEQVQRGAELAVADLNAGGGVLGQQVRLVTADDFCDPEQAVAAARKLVSEGVILVVGHMCSHASIPASAIYSSHNSGEARFSPPACASHLRSSGPQALGTPRVTVYLSREETAAVAWRRSHADLCVSL